MSENTEQPILNSTLETNVISGNSGQITPKRKSALIWMLPLILVLIAAGGVYYYFNLRQVNQKETINSIITPSISPSESLKPKPTSTEVSNSIDSSALEKELNDTDLGSFETDLKQLDTSAEQL